MTGRVLALLAFAVQKYKIRDTWKKVPKKKVVLAKPPSTCFVSRGLRFGLRGRAMRRCYYELLGCEKTADKKTIEKACVARSSNPYGVVREWGNLTRNVAGTSGQL
jgi:hypothetical protein